MDANSTSNQSFPPQRVQLGKTSLMISPLGIGTWQWGDRFWGYGQGSYTDDDLHAVFMESLRAGINFFDTAESYGGGRSEILLGQSLRSSGQQPVVATKFMPYPWRISRTNLMRFLKNSLKRLGLNRVDLYQIHWPFPPVPVETWAEALADAVGAGLTQAVGVSNYNLNQMRRSYQVLAKHNIPLASNQVRFNLLSRHPEKNGLLQACNEMGVTLIAYSPLAQGLLSGKYTPQNPIQGTRGLRHNRLLGQVQPLIGLMREIGQAHSGKSPAQIALNWVMAKKAVPIPGAKNLRQCQETIGAMGWSLTESEVAALDEASDRIH